MKSGKEMNGHRFCLILALLLLIFKPLPIHCADGNETDIHPRKGDRCISIESLSSSSWRATLGYKVFFKDNQAVQILLGLSAYYNYEKEPVPDNYYIEPYVCEYRSLTSKLGFRYYRYFLSYQRFNLFYSVELSFGLTTDIRDENYQYPFNRNPMTTKYTNFSVDNCYLIGFETPITGRISLNVQAGTYF